MFKKYFSSVMIVTSAFTIVFGQAPEASQGKPAPQVFSFSFDGNGSYLGVQTAEVTRENFGRFGLKAVRGVAVEKVLENSPAAVAGVRDGDVILKFNGDDVTSTRKLTRLVGEVEPDHQVKLLISRGGSEQELTATVGKRPGAHFAEGSFGPMLEKFQLDKLPNFGTQFKNFPDLKDLPEMKGFDFKDLPDSPGFRSFSFPGEPGKGFTWSSSTGRQIGVGVDPLTKQLAQHFGVDGGVLINEVRDGSPAARAGLKAGDIIVEANGKQIRNDLDLIGQVNASKDGDVQLVIMRDGKRQTISVTPEAAKDGGIFFRHDDGGDGRVLVPAPRQAPGTPAPPAAPAAPAFRFNRII